MKLNSIEDYQSIFSPNLVIKPICITVSNKSPSKFSRNCRFTVRLPSVEVERTPSDPLKSSNLMNSELPTKAYTRKQANLTPNFMQIDCCEDMKKKIFRSKSIKSSKSSKSSTKPHTADQSYQNLECLVSKLNSDLPSLSPSQIELKIPRNIRRTKRLLQKKGKENSRNH